MSASSRSEKPCASVRSTSCDCWAGCATARVEDLGLEGAVAQLVEFWKVRHPRISIRSRDAENGVGIGSDAIIYRIVQESISNAVRHGVTSEIDVKVDVNACGGVDVEVADDGGGLESTKRLGNGLTGMRERVTSRGGTLEVGNTADGSGTCVSAHIPSGLMAHEPTAMSLSSAGSMV